MSTVLGVMGSDDGLRWRMGSRWYDVMVVCGVRSGRSWQLESDHGGIHDDVNDGCFSSSTLV